MSLASARDRALEFADRLQALRPIVVTRFFGGAGLLKDGVQFAFVIKGVLYLRVDDKRRRDFEALGAAPFAYAGRSKTVKVARYYEVPDEIADDPDELGRWASEAHRAALAARPSPERQKPSRPARGASGHQI
jgi:TfoX/Sxy family transcriptional regulator of competence genes